MTVSVHRRRAARLAAACLLPLLGGLSLLSLTGCSGDEAAAGAGGGRPPSLVRVGRVEQRDVMPQVTVVGSVVPVRTSVVASGADGVVEEFAVEEGDYVRKDDLLSQLRMLTTNLGIDEARAVLEERKREWEELVVGSREEDKNESLARMKATEAIVKNTAKKLVRARMLLQRGSITQDEFDDVDEKAESASQAYLAAKATYERIIAGPRQEEIDRAHARYQAQIAQVDYLEAEKDKRYTLAPFDGFVVKEHTYRGQWLSKGDPVVTLARMDEVDVVVNVDQQDQLHIQLFDEARVRINGIAQRDWTGKIVAVVPRSEWQSGSRGFPVKVRLQNSYVTTEDVDEQGNEIGRLRPVLKEGLMAEVTFSGEPLSAMLAPKNALVRTSRGTQMFVFEPLLAPRWSVKSGDDVLGNVVAATESEAMEKGRAQFGTGDDAQLSVEQTARPRWEIRPPADGDGDGEADVLGYLEADSEESAGQQARQDYNLPADAQIEILPQLGTVRRVLVELGISEGEMIQVFAEGVADGAYVVTEGAERLQDYQDVQLPQKASAGKSEKPAGR